MSEAAQAVEPQEQPQEQSLDDLLNEFDSAVQQPEKPEVEQPEQKAEQKPYRHDDLDELRQFKQHYEAEQTRKEIQNTVSQVKNSSDSLKDLDDDLIEGYLQTKAARDQRVAYAWAMRHANPDGWQKIVDKIGSELSSKFKPVDAKMTEDLNAVRAAVSQGGAVEQKVSVKDLNQMSDSEFAAYKASLSN